MPVATIGGQVFFDELNTSPSQVRASRFATGNPVNRATTRTGRILWSQLEAFLTECIPNPPNLPGQHPEAPYLYVNSVNVVPEPGVHESCDGEVATFLTGVATITYTPLDYTPDRITRNTTFSMDVMNIPFSQMYWAGVPGELDPEATIEGVVIPNPDITSYIHIPVVEHSYTFENVPLMSAPAIRTAIRENLGKVNQAEFDGYPAEALLFAGGRISFTFGNLGFQTFSYEYSFHERILSEGENEFGWNHFFRSDQAGSGKWDRMSTSQETYKPIYELSDSFGELFTGTVI